MFSMRSLFSDWKQWGLYRIPLVGLIVLIMLLLVGSVTNIERAFFIQKVVLWVLGAALISYGHSLAYSIQEKLQKENFKDLTILGQSIAMAVHVIWFAFFVVVALAYSGNLCGIAS